MTIQRRIFWSNLCTVLAALLTLLAVTGGMLRLVNHYQIKQAQQLMSVQSAQVQTVLNEWDGSAPWEVLDGQLREQGYDLHAAQGKRVLYSSLDPMQQRVWQHFSESVWPEENAVSLQSEGMILVGRQDGDITLVAILRPDMGRAFGPQRLQSETTLLVFLVGGLACIAVIMLLSLWFSKKQMQRILRPLQDLVEAARRMEQGDLTTPIGYQGQDEFAAVCSAFDRMQEHIQQDNENRDRYEKARTNLVAGISHDLRTPLTSVKGYIPSPRSGACAGRGKCPPPDWSAPFHSGPGSRCPAGCAPASGQRRYTPRQTRLVPDSRWAWSGPPAPCAVRPPPGPGAGAKCAASAFY